MTKDIIQMGRIVRIPQLLGAEGDLLEKDGTSSIARARRKLTPQEREEIHELKDRALRGEDISGSNDPALAVRKVTYTFTKKIKDIFGVRIIRRTIASKRWDGSPINESLPDYEQVWVPCILSPDEHKGLEAAISHLKDKYVLV